MVAEVDVKGRNALIGGAEAVSKALAYDERHNRHIPAGSMVVWRMELEAVCVACAVLPPTQEPLEGSP